MTTPEGKVKGRLDRMLKSLGVFYIPTQAGPYGKSGVHDRILCVCGLFVSVEVKADAKKVPTKLQLLFGDQAAAAGACVFYVYEDKDIEALRDWIVSIRNTRLQSVGDQVGRPERTASFDPDSEG